MKKITLVIGIVVGILLLFLAFTSYGHEHDRTWEAYARMVALIP